VARAAAVSAAAAQPVGLVIGPSGVPIPSCGVKSRHRRSAATLIHAST
jgi:hypothetical protein